MPTNPNKLTIFPYRTHKNRQQWNHNSNCLSSLTRAQFHIFVPWVSDAPVHGLYNPSAICPARKSQENHRNSLVVLGCLHFVVNYLLIIS